MTHKVKGIILNKKDYRENDRLFVIYTDELGKIEAAARGVRKIKSKMAGHLNYFSIIDLMVASGKNHYQIASAEIDKNFLNLKSDLIKIILASYCLEIVDSFVKQEHKDLKIYELIEELLEVFNSEREIISDMYYFLAKVFILKLLALLGWTPELFYCLKCKKNILPDGNLLDASKGGLICGACGRGRGSVLSVSNDTIKILRFILQKDLKNLTVLKINKSHLNEVAKIISLFLLIHQDKELKSDRWINSLTRFSAIC